MTEESRAHDHDHVTIHISSGSCQENKTDVLFFRFTWVCPGGNYEVVWDGIFSFPFIKNGPVFPVMEVFWELVKGELRQQLMSEAEGVNVDLMHQGDQKG